MSKGQGQKIAIKFTQPITSLTETPENGWEAIETNEGNLTAYGTYSSYAPANLIDENTSNYWQTRLVGGYIQLELDNMRFIESFSIYKTTGSAPTEIRVEASEDGFQFETLNSVSLSYGNGWYSVPTNSKKYYKVYRLYPTFNSRCYIYELKYKYLPLLNEVAFKITGQEYQYLNGPLINKIYGIEKINRHPSEANSIMITTETYNNRFNNSVGNLTIEYDSSIGDLLGQGGKVESFNSIFLPTELDQLQNPHISDSITVNANITVEFLKVNYKRGFENEVIAVSAIANVEFIDVSVINP